MYRLYVDEVGSDDCTNLEQDNNRYLSLTGIAMKLRDARDDLAPRFDRIKIDIFDHDIDDPIVFHRTDIVQRKRAFGCLNNDDKRAAFDDSIFDAIQNVDYTVITAFIDKLGMTQQAHWSNQHPYHYLMEILVEKYAQFLKRRDDIGDIMPEGRKGKKDDALQKAFTSVIENGTRFVSGDFMGKYLSSKLLKIRYKPQNVAGLQLCDLIAHPSHMFVRERLNHQINMGDFCKKVKPILSMRKYDRSAYGTIKGYGYKHLP